MRSQTRPYTTEYHHINAKWFKPLLTKMVGFYALNNELKEYENDRVLALFSISLDCCPSTVIDSVIAGATLIKPTGL